MLRVPLADGTLVPTPGVPSDDLVPSLLATSDVLGTGWFAADAANVKPGSTVVVVGDGAVGLLGVLSAKQMGAERIIAMSRHETRQKLAREFGATDIVDRARRRGRGPHHGHDQGHRRRLGAGMRRHAGVDDAGDPLARAGAGTSPTSASRTGSSSNGEELFFAHVHLHGGPAPVRRYLPKLIDLVLNGKINPGKVFDLTLPLDQVAEGYRAMDERRAIKALLRP